MGVLKGYCYFVLPCVIRLLRYSDLAFRSTKLGGLQDRNSENSKQNALETEQTTELGDKVVRWAEEFLSYSCLA